MKLTWIKDTAERVVVTFFEAWLSAWIIIENATVSDLLKTDVLTIGVVAAVASFLKALAATQVGSKDSASLAG